MSDLLEFYDLEVAPVWRLPPEHYEAIGRVTVNSSALEIALGQVITRLSGVEERRGFALVEPYGFQQRISKIKQLLAFWDSKNSAASQGEAIAKVAAFVRNEFKIDGLSLQELSQKRNMATHRQWVGTEHPLDDEISYERHIHTMLRAKIYGKPVADPNSVEFEPIRLDEMRNLGETFWKAAIYVRLLLPELPPIPVDD